MASDSSSGFFLISDQGHYTFLYRYAKHNREGGGKEQTNKYGLGLAPSARKGESVTLCSSPCICRLSRACILRETSTKPLTQQRSSRVGQPGLCGSTGLLSRLSDFCWLSSLPCFYLLTASFCWLCHSLDCYLKLTVLFFLALSTAFSVFSRTFLPSSTSGLAGDLALRPFVWVSRQNRQRDRLSGANTNGNELLRIMSQ